MINIKINDQIYTVEVAKSEEDKKIGLQHRKSLDKDKGMLFDFSDNPGEKSFHMEDTLIPLDQIFINEDQEVISVITRRPKDKNLITIKNVAYVLELNANSGVEIGDELEFEDDEGPVMKVLAPDGSTQFELWGGERIVSRRETKILIKKAKKADQSQDDKDYKALGRYLFKVFNKQDNREPEYVSLS